MFFIQKKYSEEVEKNNKHKNKEPSIARMTILGLMARSEERRVGKECGS